MWRGCVPRSRRRAVFALALCGACADGAVSGGSADVPLLDVAAGDGHAAGDAAGDASVDVSAGDVADLAGPAVTIVGRAALTGPVTGAEVEAWTLSPTLEARDLVATGKTGTDGTFALEVPPGRVEVRVRGVQARYQAGEVSEKFDVDDALSALADTGTKLPEQLNVNAWTTMARSLARGYVLKGHDASLAVEMARVRIGDHLWRPAPHAIDNFEVVLPGESSFVGAQAVLGLTHLGLMGLAQQWSASIGLDVKVVDVVTALSYDLRDGLFDGLWPGADGSQVAVHVAGGKPVTADSTRWELASAIFALTPGLDQGPLLAVGGLYEDLALDDGPLYPPTQPARPFDPVAPILVWEPPTPEPNALLAAAPQVRVRASDASGVAEVWGTVSGGAVEVPLVLSPVVVEPTERVEAGTVPLDALPDGAALVTVSASDPDGNVATVSLGIHVDRTAPSLVVVAPAVGATNVAEAGVLLEVSDPLPSSGLAAGVATVEVLLDGEALEVAAEGSSYSAAATYAAPAAHAWTFRATDGLGNTAEVSGAVVYDPDPPSLGVDAPASDAWLTETEVLATGTASDDGVGIAAVWAQVSGGPQVSAVVGDGVWHATLAVVPDGWRTLTVRAADTLGNEAALERAFGVDTVAPVVTVAPGIAGGFYPSTAISVQGTASDATSGVAAVRLAVEGGSLIEVPSGLAGGWTAELPLAPSGVPTVVEVSARDVAGNVSKALPLVVTSDLEPPVLSLLAPPADQVWFNSPGVTLAGTATDLVSGVAQVHVQIDGGSWMPAGFLPGAQPGVWEWTAAVFLTDAGKPVQGLHTVRVRAVDGAGNQSDDLVRELLLDTVKPVVKWGLDEGYVPEDLCKVVVVGEGVSYTCPDVKKDHILGIKCSPSCGTLKKFPHRLAQGIDFWNGTLLTEQNVPTFVVEATDPEAVPGAPPLELQYRFLWPAGSGKAQSPWASLPGTVLPLASALFMGPGVPGATTVLPSGVQVRALDAAGNASDPLAATFTLELVTPPVIVEPVAAALQLQSGLEFSLTEGTAHQPFRASPTAVRVRQVRLWNPYPMALQVGVLTPQALTSPLWATVSGERVYGAKTPVTGPALCASDGCLYEPTLYAGEASYGGTCADLASSAAAWSRDVKSPAYSLAVRAAPAGVPTPLAGSQSLAPGASVWLDVLVSYAGTCPLLDPFPYAPYGTGLIYVRPDGDGCASATPHPLDDRATCWYQEKCGFDCPVGGPAPCSACQKTAFVRPWLSLVRKVRLWTPPGQTITLGVSVAADGATPIPWTANLLGLVVDAAVTATAGEAAPFPHW